MRISGKKFVTLCLVAAMLFSLPLAAFGTVAGAKRSAYAIARTFSNMGFNVRDTYQYGLLMRGESHTIKTTLYAGNAYVFIAGGCEDAYDVDIRVFDENGNLVARDSDHEDVAVAEVTPRWTGPFYIKITMYDSTSNGAHWVLVTGYK